MYTDLTPKGIDFSPQTNIITPSMNPLYTTTPAPSPAQSSSLIGGLAGAAASIFNTATTTLNPKVRADQIALADANARAAEANATAQTAQSFDPRFIIAAVAIVILVIVVLMRAKSN